MVRTAACWAYLFFANPAAEYTTDYLGFDLFAACE
jgi:hypothetical protein